MGWIALRALLPLLALAGCARGGVWANVPDDPGPQAAACRREAEDSPQYRLYGSMAGGNTANAERVRQDLLVALPRIYHACMIRTGGYPPGTPMPPIRVTF
jgi:hypothetical protein